MINEELKNATVVTITEMQEEIVSTPTESETTTTETSTEAEGSTETQAASE